MKRINITTQSELDAIAKDHVGTITIEGGNSENPIVIKGFKKTTFVCRKNSEIKAYDQSTVVANDQSTVRAYDQSTVLRAINR